jgi:AcrR family transcriptional regulator
MTKRKDGIQTRNRILSEACAIFAKKGYHDATVEEICRHAKSNIAAINYHFGSKDQLYARVWRKAFDEAMEAYPAEGGLGPDAALTERLKGTIHSLVGKAVDPGRIGHAGKLLLREMVNPTDVIRHVKRDALQPLHDRMNNLMRELLGPKASEEQLLLCQMSIVHQCMAIGIRFFSGTMPPDKNLNTPSEQLIEILTNHILRFSLAGIEAIRKEIKTGRDSICEVGLSVD